MGENVCVGVCMQTCTKVQSRSKVLKATTRVHEILQAIYKYMYKVAIHTYKVQTWVIRINSSMYMYYNLVICGMCDTTV